MSAPMSVVPSVWWWVDLTRYQVPLWTDLPHTSLCIHNQMIPKLWRKSQNNTDHQTNTAHHLTCLYISLLQSLRFCYKGCWAFLLLGHCILFFESSYNGTLSMRKHQVSSSRHSHRPKKQRLPGKHCYQKIQSEAHPSLPED